MPAQVPDALLIGLRWMHGLAAVALLGYTLALLLRPAPAGLESVGEARRFKEIMDLTLLVFLASGIILSFDRLSRGPGTVYAVLLTLKISLAFAAYQAASLWRRQGLHPTNRYGQIVLIAGACAMLIAVVLKESFEGGIARQTQ